MATTLAEIEALAQTYAESCRELESSVQALEDGVRTIKRKLLPTIRRLAEESASHKSALRAAVAAQPALFERPRSRLFHGVKCGFAKKKGRVDWDDEAKVIERIEKLLPRDQVELLIRATKSVHKPGVYDLTVADLKRLGITIVGDGDEVVVKHAGSDIEKLVDALLDDETSVAKDAA